MLSVHVVENSEQVINLLGAVVPLQMLQLDTAWRIKAQKEQLAQLACKVRAGQEEQDTTEAQLLQKERSAAKQVCETTIVSLPRQAAFSCCLVCLCHKLLWQACRCLCVLDTLHPDFRRQVSSTLSLNCSFLLAVRPELGRAW